MKLPKAYATNVQKKSIDMTLSVNPLGCSPRVLRAARRVNMKDICLYPDQSALLQRLASNLRVRNGNILLGTGSEQLIKLACLTFLQGGGTAAVEAGSFFLFSREPMLTKADTVFFDFDLPRKLRSKPDLLFIANPTTPGGCDRSSSDIVRIIDSLSPKIAVIDEANGEFGTSPLIPEIAKRPNLIVLRTFSKALGLAGLRIGMAVGNTQAITNMSKFQQPFPVSSVALRAAEAALNDTVFLRKTTRFVTRERKFLTDELVKRGLRVSPSVTNNLFITGKNIRRIIRLLAEKNVSVIDGTFFPKNMQPGFRILLRDKKTNRAFLARLDEVLACLTPNKLLRSKEVV